MRHFSILWILVMMVSIFPTLGHSESLSTYFQSAECNSTKEYEPGINIRF